MARGSVSDGGRNGRGAALLAVALVHLAIGYALVVGLGVVAPFTGREPPTRLILIDQPPPPPRVPAPKPKPSPHKAGGAPAPLAPPPPLAPTVAAVALPAPAPIVPVPAPVAAGVPASGAGGAGLGAGGAGSGAGAGFGEGDDGAYTEAEQIKGRFRNSDYPKSAKGAGRIRTGVRYAVGPDGVVRDCTVTSTSGWPEVDAMTCRVITDRYRFRPARNARGEPITQVIEEGYSWTGE